MGFPYSSIGKKSTYNAGDPGSIPGLGRSLEKGEATHSSILAWRILWTVIVHGVAKSWTQLSDFHSTSPHFSHGVSKTFSFLTASAHFINSIEKESLFYHLNLLLTVSNCLSNCKPQSQVLIYILEKKL